MQCLFAAVMIIYEVGSKIRKVEEETTMIPGFSVVWFMCWSSEPSGEHRENFSTAAPQLGCSPQPCPRREWVLAPGSGLGIVEDAWFAEVFWWVAEVGRPHQPDPGLLAQLFSQV